MFIINRNQYSGACSLYRTVIIRLSFTPMFKHKTYIINMSTYTCVSRVPWRITSVPYQVCGRLQYFILL